jgi:hypothetical protein
MESRQKPIQYSPPQPSFQVVLVTELGHVTTKLICNVHKKRWKVFKKEIRYKCTSEGVFTGGGPQGVGAKVQVV